MVIMWIEHMLEAKSKFINRATKTGKKQYDKYFIYVPTPLAKDSNFPFDVNDEVIIRIDPEKKELIIKKRE